MSDVTNGIGGSETVGTTANYSTVSTDHKQAMTLKVWNTHATQTLYATVNTYASGGPAHETASAVAIPAGENFFFVSHDKPIRSLGLSASGADTTATWGAY